MFSIVVSITATDTEVWISLFLSSNSRIPVMLDQEDDPYLYGKWLNADKRLTCFITYIERILGRVKVA